MNVLAATVTARDAHLNQHATGALARLFNDGAQAARAAHARAAKWRTGLTLSFVVAVCAAEMLGIVVVSTGAYHEEGEDAAFEAARKHIPRINHIFMLIVGLLMLAQACVLRLFWGQQGDSEQM